MNDLQAAERARLIAENNRLSRKNEEDLISATKSIAKVGNGLWGSLFGAWGGYHLGALIGRAAAGASPEEQERGRVRGGLSGMLVGGPTLGGVAYAATGAQKRKKKRRIHTSKKKKSHTRQRKHTKKKKKR